MEQTAPPSIVAGDSASWRVTLPEYPAGDWTLRYSLINANALHTIEASADGDEYLVTLAPATTAGWAPGRYEVTAYVESATERHTLGHGHIQIQPNPVSGPRDTRSHARKVLDAIESFLETGDIMAGQVQIADRRIANIPIPDLLSLRDRYRAEVKREESGGKAGRLYVRL